eukprot:COSAG05_NODE_166_length_15185_cov_10.343497_5_plen_348_part_00
MCGRRARAVPPRPIRPAPPAAAPLSSTFDLCVSCVGATQLAEIGRCGHPMHMRLPFLACLLAAAVHDAAAIYCEPEECYKVLGLPSLLDASVPPTDSEIKKAYRKLSMVWHPDKCKEEGCEAKFVDIANAYNILSNKESRDAYDYFLEHPEAYGHTARYYKAVLAPEIPLWVVAVGFVLVMSVIHHGVRWQMYWRAQHWAKKSDVYKSRVAKMLEEQGADPAEVGEQELGTDDGIELELTGYPKPVWTDLFVFQLPLIPLRFGYAVYRASRWVVKYSILRQPYDKDARIYLTQEIMVRQFGVNWKYAPQVKKDEWVAAKVSALPLGQFYLDIESDACGIRRCGRTRE